MEIYNQNPYFNTFYDRQAKFMKITWLPESENGTIQEFILLNEAILSGLEVTYFLSDLRDFKFSIIPQSQLDIVKYSSGRMSEAGVKKIAIVMPKDIFAMVSVEQTVDETKGKIEFEIQIFESYEKAATWILA